MQLLPVAINSDTGLIAGDHIEVEYEVAGVCSGLTTAGIDVLLRLPV